MSQLTALLGAAGGGQASEPEPESSSGDAGGLDLSALLGGAASQAAPEPEQESSEDTDKQMLMKLLSKL